MFNFIDLDYKVIRIQYKEKGKKNKMMTEPLMYPLAGRKIIDFMPFIKKRSNFYAQKLPKIETLIRRRSNYPWIWESEQIKEGIEEVEYLYM